MAPRVCWRCAAGYGLQDTVRTAREQSQKIKIDRMPERWPWLRIRPNRHARRLRATACCVGGRLLRRAAGDRGTARAVRGFVGTAGGRGAGCSGESRGTEERAPRGSSNGVHPSAHDPRRSRWRRTCRAWRRACSWTLRPPRRARTAAWAAAATAPASTDPRARARGRVTEGGASLATAGCCSISVRTNRLRARQGPHGGDGQRGAEGRVRGRVHAARGGRRAQQAIGPVQR